MFKFAKKSVADIKVKLFCSNCFKTHEKQISDLTDDGYGNYSYICDCGNKAYDIDNMMIDFIVRLNKMNFYTKYCCEGHWDSVIPSCSSYPYILFTHNNDDDCQHKISLKDHEYLYKFLEKNLNPILKVSLFNDKAISISSERYISNRKKFKLFKEECLTEFNRIIGLLENDRDRVI